MDNNKTAWTSIRIEKNLLNQLRVAKAGIVTLQEGDNITHEDAIKFLIWILTNQPKTYIEFKNSQE